MWGDPERRSIHTGAVVLILVAMFYWFEVHRTMESAIQREKRIKKWNRAWKLKLIEATNPDWRDLVPEIGLLPIVSLCSAGFPPSRE